MTGTITNIAVRAFQILFTVIVLGLSVGLAKGHKWGSTPITLGYASFVGAISLVAAFVGLAATWVEMLGGFIGMVIDGFILLLNLAGGVLIAIKLKGINCADKDPHDVLTIYYSDIINGGCHGKGQDQECYWWPEVYGDQNGDNLRGRCKMNQADSAFMFLTVVILLVSLTLTFLRQKKGY